jgi:hypothetical protein
MLNNVVDTYVFTNVLQTIKFKDQYFQKSHHFRAAYPSEM